MSVRTTALSVALGSVVVALGAWLAACGSSGRQRRHHRDDGGDGLAATTGDDGAPSNGDANGGDANGNASGDGGVSPLGACAAAGASCAVSTDCCSGACVNGTCGATQCLTIGAACPVAGNACCTGNCVNGACAAITANPTCTTAGNACKANGDCCSGLCSAGTCAIASSFCVQPNDICYDGASCCTGACDSPNASPVSATNPGTCSATPPASGGVNCTGVDGVLCNPADVGCAGGCCSALCAPYGPTGVAICQQAQGCHVEGDLCRKDSDCCGGESADAGILGAGLVVCSTSTNGGTIGVCTTPSASNGGGNTCVPEGDVCHYNTPPYACSVSAKRSDCCGDQSPKFLACQLDPLGVPRCLAYGGDGGAGCRASGDTCATAADCCDGTPCVPNAQGQLTCAAAACVPVSGACTSSADCCAGVSVRRPGRLDAGDVRARRSAHERRRRRVDRRRRRQQQGGGGGLGCASLAQSCASLGCCAGLECVGSACQLPPK